FSQVEAGIRSVDKLSVLAVIAGLLQVSVETLAGKPWRFAPNGGAQLDALDDIRRALTGYGHLLAQDHQPWPLPQLRAAVVEAHRTYQEASYSRTAQMLPDLLLAVDAYGEASPAVQTLRSSAYVVAAKLL